MLSRTLYKNKKIKMANEREDFKQKNKYTHNSKDIFIE